jgi:hypothetical protein
MHHPEHHHTEDREWEPTIVDKRLGQVSYGVDQRPHDMASAFGRSGKMEPQHGCNEEQMLAPVKWGLDGEHALLRLAVY